MGQLDAEVSVVRRSGAPELWRRVKRRYVLLGAAAVLPPEAILLEPPQPASAPFAHCDA